jgi:hypothetical protein
MTGSHADKLRNLDISVETVADCFLDVPLLAKLRFVSSLLMSNGGYVGNTNCDPVQVAAAEILKGAIELLVSHPTAANLTYASLPEKAAPRKKADTGPKI